VPTYQKGTKGKYQLVVSEKSWNKLKQNIKTITRKTTPLSIAERINKLKEVGRGWLNYFRMASITGKLKDFDSWIRNRIRYCIWHNWRKPERKRKNLLRLGIDLGHAYAWSRTRMGGWAVAHVRGAPCYRQMAGPSTRLQAVFPFALLFSYSKTLIVAARGICSPAISKIIVSERRGFFKYPHEAFELSNFFNPSSVISTPNLEERA
jgi:hypothetical protein